MRYILVMSICLLLIALCVRLGNAQFAINQILVPGPNPGASTPVIVGVTVGGGATVDYTTGIASGATIGTISVQETGGVFLGTIALGGTDAAKFTLSSTVLPATLNANGSTPTCTSATNYHITITPTQNGIVNSGTAYAITVGCQPAGSVTVTAVNLTNVNFTTGTAGTVGVLSATLSSGSPTGSFTLANSGADHSGTTCQNYSADFTVSGTNLNNSSGAPAQSYPGTCVTYTQSGLANSPYTQAFTLTGSASGGAPTPPSFTSPSSSGFTTVAMNLDFTGATTSNLGGTTYNASSLSSWLDCAGASAPVFYNVGVGTSAAPCSDDSIVTDASIGHNVLQMILTANDWTNGYYANNMQTAQSGGSGAPFPPTGLREVIFRSPINPDTIYNLSGSSNPNPLYWNWWSYPTPACVEIDFIEFSVPNNSSGGSVIDHCGGDAGGGTAPSTWGQVSGWNIQNYHTYDTRITGDGVSENAICEWLDGASLGCSDWASGYFSSGWYSSRYYLIFQLGPFFSQDTGIVFNGPVQMYIQRVTNYECANWSGSQNCWGTVLKSCSVGQTTPC